MSNDQFSSACETPSRYYSCSGRAKTKKDGNRQCTCTIGKRTNMMVRERCNRNGERNIRCCTDINGVRAPVHSRDYRNKKNLDYSANPGGLLPALVAEIVSKSLYIENCTLVIEHFVF